MAQQAIDALRANSSSQSASQPVPTLGMRGGLGKTLLIAFLLLTIVPLSLLAVLTYNQIQRDTRNKLVASLETVVSLKEAHLLDWVGGYEQQLSLLARVLDQDSDVAAQLAAVVVDDPTLTALSLVDLQTGEVLASTDPAWAEGQELLSVVGSDRALSAALGLASGDEPLPVIRYVWADRMLVGLPSWDALQQIVTAFDSPEEGRYTSLVTSDGWTLSADGLIALPAGVQDGSSQGTVESLSQGQSGSGVYTNSEGEPVFGAYRWNPELQVGILTEQSQQEALATGNTLTAMVVGVTLAVALITSALAAVFTRRVTRPIVQLTETAAHMARGDLDQQVTIDRKDEIGILARAFNRMAAELTVLYGDLEAKVAERTMQLEVANRQTSYHMVQLATSAEVARVAASIRELEPLLTTVAGLIGRAFELHSAAIYLLDSSGQWAVVGASPGQASETASRSWPEPVEVGEATLVGRVAADWVLRVVRTGEIASPGLEAVKSEALRPPVMCEMAVPLRVRDRALGVLDLQSVRPGDFGEDETVVYQSLADQISIAIENARAYAVEKETVARLRELDQIQSQFLTNMSHALRIPLNSIIGFSRVMLKELDGPLNDVQRTDLLAIHDSGRELLGLINDMLDLSQLQLGLAPFSPSEVNLSEIIEGVMATAQALARGKAVQLYEEVPQDLPPLYTDGKRIRQVILALMSNAIKFTDKGTIHLRASSDDGRVTISVQDTGLGIPKEELSRMFSDARYGEPDVDRDVLGFGLAISKRVVEKLGGQIWVESVEGAGSSFTFTLPRSPIEVEQV